MSEPRQSPAQEGAPSTQPYGAQPPAGGPWPGSPSGPPQAYGPPPSYPRERPDFEPPPDWARPRPGAPGSNGGPPPALRPYGTNQPPMEPTGGGVKRGSVIAIAVIAALLAGMVGATAGVYLTMKYAQSVTVTPLPQPSEDGLGKKQSAFAKPQDVARVADSLLPSVVQIKVTAAEGKATGSGFIIRGDGHVLTNNHVVAMAAKSGTITVGTEDGQELSAKIIGRSPSYDLAVIKVSGGRNLRPVALGDSNKITVGEPVVAVGAPLGLHGTVTSGIISARNRPVTAGDDDGSSYINAIQTDAAINPGNSGGPLVNMKAEVIGVNSAIATLGGESNPFGSRQQQGSIGLGFSIPINQARRTANQLIEKGHAVYPVIGANLDPSYSGVGARLQTVNPGSGADNSGLHDGDVVTSINGHKVTGSDDLIVQIRSRLPGQKVAIEYTRSGKPLRVNVTLDEQIDND